MELWLVNIYGKRKMIKEFAKIAIKSLKTRPIRSWLTMIGVIIGVFLIVSLMSLSEGVKGAMMQQLKMMGNDLIMIFPGEMSDIGTMMAGGLELTEDDMVLSAAAFLNNRVPNPCLKVRARFFDLVSTMLNRAALPVFCTLTCFSDKTIDPLIHFQS